MTITRWWHTKGFGIESRTDFDYLHEVLREKSPYYAYADLEREFPNASRREMRLARLLFRVCNREQPSEIRLSGTPSDLNLAAMEKAHSNGGGGALLFGEGEAGIEMLDGVSVLALTHIHSRNAEVWRQVLLRQDAITYDMETVGVALFRPNRTAEHYNIRKTR